MTFRTIEPAHGGPSKNSLRCGAQNGFLTIAIGLEVLGQIGWVRGQVVAVRIGEGQHWGIIQLIVATDPATGYSLTRNGTGSSSVRVKMKRPPFVPEFRPRRVAFKAIENGLELDVAELRRLAQPVTGVVQPIRPGMKQQG